MAKKLVHMIISGRKLVLLHIFSQIFLFLHTFLHIFTYLQILYNKFWVILFEGHCEEYIPVNATNRACHIVISPHKTYYDLFNISLGQGQRLSFLSDEKSLL